MHLYVLVAVLTLLGLGIFLYKAYVLNLPLSPRTPSEVWNVEASISFTAKGGPVKVSMYVPMSTRAYGLVDEHFISGGYGLVTVMQDGNRRATWSIRDAKGKQSLYYKAGMVRVRTKAPLQETERPKVEAPEMSEAALQAAKALIAEIKAKSADTPTMVAELIKRLNKAEPDENAKLLLGPQPTLKKKVQVAVNVLLVADIPARMVSGIRLESEKYEFSQKTPLLHWLEVHHKKQWLSFDPLRGKSPVPDDWLRWWRGSESLVHQEGGEQLRVVMSVSPRIEEGVVSAVRRGQIAEPLLLRFSLFSLPVKTQAVYRVLLLIPVGSLLLVFLRNIIGIRTFGTFMPVLIGLSFRETGLLWGALLFSVVVAMGLSVRFYLERLKLLVVPRLAAVLTVVILLMVGLSLITHLLGLHRGLSVALFPMVILTMTIERMSVVWEERGSTEALISGVGSLVTAALAFLVMNVKVVEHLVFVFPELLLVVLAITLLIGRYTGYRLADLYRFRALARS
ncbi:MAG: inactive transglutaminase family protein [Thermodesulfobacteriota bacterium]